MKKLFLLLAFVVLVIPIKVKCQSLLTGIEEYYKFDETSGQAINSVSTVNYSSSITATQGVSGKIGTCYSYNGISNMVSFADHENWTISQSGSLSISAWINLSGQITANGYGNIWGFQTGPSFYLKYISSGNYQLGWYTGNTEANSGTLSFSLNTWYHVIMVKNGSSITFYRNGTAIGTVTASDNTINPSAVYIGSDTHTTPEAFNGKIDELGIWKKALTLTEVSQLYAGGNGLSYPFGTTVSVTGVTLSPTTASIAVGGTQQLTKTIAPANATNQNVTWSSNNTSVATVNSSGLVTAVAAGSATITVTTVDQAKTATCAVTVTTSTVNVTGVSVSPTTQSISAGSSFQLAATITPSNATNQNVTWSSSNTTVATVNSSGLVTAVTAGSATITVTTVDQAKTATCAVTVTTGGGGSNYWQPGTGGIYYNGNVGIGLTNPSCPLDVNGILKIRGGIEAAGVIEINHSITTDWYRGIDFEVAKVRLAGIGVQGTGGIANRIYLGIGESGVMSILPNGNVGIGTITPRGSLDVTSGDVWLTSSGTSSSNFIYAPGNIYLIPRSDGISYLFAGRTGTMSEKGSSQLQLYTYDNGKSVEAIRINSVGNVGIGTTTPNNTLDIKGGAVIGATYAGTNTAPANGLLVQGKVGIGTSDPLATLHILNENPAIILDNNPSSTNDLCELKFAQDGTIKSSIYWSKSRNDLVLNNNGKEAIIIDNTGRVKIDGILEAEGVEVKLDVLPDFVFEKDYNMRSLTDLESFIKENKHLPDVPTAKDVKQNGLDIGEMNSILLQKVEELTLYVIELQKEIEKIKKE